MRTTILLMVLLAGCVGFSGPTQEQLTSADYGVYPDKYQEIVEAYLRKHLIDPDSMRDLEVSVPVKSWATDQYGSLRFGYLSEVLVNAKNRMGGYTGRQLEWVLIRDGQVVFFGHRGRIGPVNHL